MFSLKDTYKKRAENAPVAPLWNTAVKLHVQISSLRVADKGNIILKWIDSLKRPADDPFHIGEAVDFFLIGEIPRLDN